MWGEDFLQRGENGTGIKEEGKLCAKGGEAWIPHDEGMK